MWLQFNETILNIYIWRERDRETESEREREQKRQREKETEKERCFLYHIYSFALVSFIVDYRSHFVSDAVSGCYSNKKNMAFIIIITFLFCFIVEVHSSIKPRQVAVRGSAR